MSTNQTPAGKTEYVKAFFAEKKGEAGGKSVEVAALFFNDKNPTLDTGTPALWGTINGTKVSAFIQPGGTSKDGKAYGPFVSISEKGAKDEATGTYAKDTPFATANMRVMPDGHSRLVIDVAGGEAIFAIPRKEMTIGLQEKIGLDLNRVNEVRAGLAAGAANEADTKKSAAPKAA